MLGIRDSEITIVMRNWNLVNGKMNGEPMKASSLGKRHPPKSAIKGTRKKRILVDWDYRVVPGQWKLVQSGIKI